RRAVLDGRLMGLHEPFLYKLVSVVSDMMKQSYPELSQTVERVSAVIKDEESNFFGTIDAGLAHIDRVFADMGSQGSSIVRGDDAARIYQTYGVPPELFEQLAVELNYTFDWSGFRDAMKRHGDESGGDAVAVFKHGPVESLKRSVKSTPFLGYETTEATAEIKGLVFDDQLCEEVSKCGEGHPLTVVLDRTPFYGESGGQVGDQGEIVGDGFTIQVTDTQRDAELILHHGYLAKGVARLGSSVEARVSTERRDGIRRAHSATHILHYALQKNLGKHAQQQGSKVDRDWLRFDFTNMAPVGVEQLATIEHDVKARVADRAAIRWDTVPLTEARKAGAMMLFGEKYPDPVRMVSMGDFSRELCGGTHLQNTGDVTAFEIVSEEGVAAGIRRITALTGAKAEEHSRQTREILDAAAKRLGVGVLDVPAACRDLVQRVRDMRKQLTSGSKGAAADTMKAEKSGPKSANASYDDIRNALRDSARFLNVPVFEVATRIESMQAEIENLRTQLTSMSAAGTISADALIESAEKVGNVSVIVAEAPGANPNVVRQLIDQIRKKLSSSAILIGATQADGKVILVAGVTQDLVGRGISAGKWVGEVAPVVGGGGGGKPDLAQAGGKIPEKLPDALLTASKYMRAQLGG
ncbi:MAG: hypothetical protein RIS70_2320, partial [Planctomycetota bacterium]